MRQLLLVLSAILVLVGCPTDPAKSPNPIPAPDSNLCGAMCDYLVQLGCEEGKPLYDSDLPGPRGVPNETCENWCIKTQDHGIFLNPRCVMKASSCLNIEEMRQKPSCE